MRLCENKEAQYEMQVKVGTCCTAPRPLSLFEFWHDHEEFYHVSASMIFDKEEVQEPYKNLVLPYTTKQTAALDTHSSGPNRYRSRIISVNTHRE